MLTAAQCKKALKGLGLRAILEKVPGLGGGHEYLVQDSADRTVASGWSLGSKTDALNDAVDSIRRKNRIFAERTGPSPWQTLPSVEDLK